VGPKVKNSRLYVRAVDSEKQLIEKAARLANLSVSEWIRDRLLMLARREAAQAGEGSPSQRGL
jgi:uncharacterized protein (DUF1778 family)